MWEEYYMDSRNKTQWSWDMRDAQDKSLRCPPEPPMMSQLLNSFDFYGQKNPYRHSYDDALWLYYEELYEDYMMHHVEEYDCLQEEILPPMSGFWDWKMHEYYDEIDWENQAKEVLIEAHMEDLMIERSYEEDQDHVHFEVECPLEPPAKIEDVKSIDALAASEYLEMLELDHKLHIGWVRDEHERPCPILSAKKKNTINM